MNEPLITLFGSMGYVGGTIATCAQSDGQNVTTINSSDFPFWKDAGAWPGQLLENSTETVILAASFEKPASREEESLQPLLQEKFAVLLDRLRTRRIIFLSSDAVFNGSRGPYCESDALSPITPYGRCKAIMETIAAKHTNVHVVRMSVVWGPGATKPDSRRRRYLEKNAGHHLGATNAFRSPIEVSRLARAIVRMTHEETLPDVLHLATPRRSYFEFLRSSLLPEMADRIEPWDDPAGQHDTSLDTEHPNLVSRLIN